MTSSRGTCAASRLKQEAQVQASVMAALRVMRAFHVISADTSRRGCARRCMYIETMEQVLSNTPDTDRPEGSSNVLYLPLDRMLHNPPDLGPSVSNCSLPENRTRHHRARGT